MLHVDNMAFSPSICAAKQDLGENVSRYDILTVAESSTALAISSSDEINILDTSSLFH